jgi:hypothetical protein
MIRGQYMARERYYRCMENFRDACRGDLATRYENGSLMRGCLIFHLANYIRVEIAVKLCLFVIIPTSLFG